MPGPTATTPNLAAAAAFAFAATTLPAKALH